MANFQNTAAGKYLESATPANGGTSGVLYVTSTASVPTGHFAAVRLKNGSTLNSPLTVATNKPVYVQGDYNVNNPQPAAIMSDATTILSDNWHDSNSTQGLSNRTATSITLNADIMTGNSATTQNGYGGGFENFLRFLESWTGQTFNLAGSLVCMWASQQTSGAWQNTGVYYNAPNRVYTFNSGQWGGKWPPGTPCVVLTQRGTWRRQ